jgi:5-methylcytosine-specific restriction endonuclease McrA
MVDVVKPRRVAWNKGKKIPDIAIARNKNYWKVTTEEKELQRRAKISRTMKEKAKQLNFSLRKYNREHGAWNKGLTKDTDERVAKYVKSMQETKKGQGCLWLTTKGLKFPEDKYPNHGMRGKKLTEKQKRKISERTTIAMSREKVREKLMLRPTFGVNHWNWKGGINKSYPSEFNNPLRRKIRERDNYECQVCYQQQSLKRKLDIHHKDGNKNNNSVNNLISLCASCHTKVETGGLGLDA